MKELARHYAIIGSVALVVFFTSLGAVRLWDRDEPRNAQCAREMLERGDWVVPTFNGSLRAAKPALLYWLMMSSYSVFGVNEFAARFGNVVLSLGTVLATYHIGRRLFGPRAGLWAGLALATCPLFDMAARAATPDAPLIFFATMAMLVYVLAVFPQANPRGTDVPAKDWFPRDWKACLALYSLLGLAVLAKGPVGFLLPLMTIGLFGLILHAEGPPVAEAWSQRLYRWASVLSPLRILARMREMRLPLGIAVVLLVAGPWYLAVGLATEGRFLREFLGNQNIGRALETMEDHSGPGPLFYLLVILAGAFPWSVLATPLVVDTWRRLRVRETWSPARVFCLCWIAAYMLVFSIARTKLPNYIAPCFPAIAVLLGAFVDRCLSGEMLADRRWVGRGLATLTGMGIVIAVGLALAAQHYLPSAMWLAALGAALAVCGLVGWLSWRDQRSPLAFGSLAAAAICMALGVHGFVVLRLSNEQQVPDMLRAAAAQAPNMRWASVNGLEPSWVFYASRPVWDETYHSDPPLKKLSEQAHAEQPTLVMFITPNVQQLQAELPADLEIVACEPLLFRNKQLALIARREIAAMLAPQMAALRGQGLRR